MKILRKLYFRWRAVIVALVGMTWALAHIFLIATIVLASSAIARAQVLHGQEIEVGSDGKSRGFYSQYFLLDQDHANEIVRPFWVNGIVTRLEIGGGPTLKIRGTTLKLTFGATTDKEVMTAGLLITKIRDHEVMYVADRKWAAGSTTSSLYQKLWWSVDKKSIWRLRYEQLNVGDKTEFVRPGIEYQIQFPKLSPKKNLPTHLYIAPFFDPKQKQLGGQIGFRFFDLRVH